LIVVSIRDISKNQKKFLGSEKRLIIVFAKKKRIINLFLVLSVWQETERSAMELKTKKKRQLLLRLRSKQTEERMSLLLRKLKKYPQNK